MDIQDMKEESPGRNRYLLVVDKCLCVYLLPAKEALGVARKLLNLVLTFGVPLPIRRDTGGGVHGTVFAEYV